jgi:hypothetical protein
MWTTTDQKTCFEKVEKIRVKIYLIMWRQRVVLQKDLLDNKVVLRKNLLDNQVMLWFIGVYTILHM